MLSHYILVYDILDQATCSLIFFVINDLVISWILKLGPEVFNYKKNKKRYYCFCKLPAVSLLKPEEDSLLSKWGEWIHEEASDMAVLLTLFGSNAEVARLQSVNAALTRFKSMTGFSGFVLSYLTSA